MSFIVNFLLKPVLGAVINTKPVSNAISSAEKGIDKLSKTFPNAELIKSDGYDLHLLLTDVSDSKESKYLLHDEAGQLKYTIYGKYISNCYTVSDSSGKTIGEVKEERPFSIYDYESESYTEIRTCTIFHHEKKFGNVTHGYQDNFYLHAPKYSTTSNSFSSKFAIEKRGKTICKINRPFSRGEDNSLFLLSYDDSSDEEIYVLYTAALQKLRLRYY